MSGITGQQPELLYTLSSPITKNTYTTQAAFTGVVGTNTVCKIPAGWVMNDVPNPVGRGFLFDAHGTIANASAATFAVAMGLDTTAGTIANSTTIYAATAPTASITTVWHCHWEGTIQAFATSTYTLQINGYWTQSATATGAALGTAGLRTDFNATITGLSPTVDIFVELFGTWSASSASNTTTVQQMFFWGLN